MFAQDDKTHVILSVSEESRTTLSFHEILRLKMLLAQDDVNSIKRSFELNGYSLRMTKARHSEPNSILGVKNLVS